MTNKNIRNIAIIAHVDHGKTTLVDCMLKQSGAFRENQQVQERVLDSNDLERERGITILSKNISIEYKGTKINVVDTPGHADFGGEVERVLGMVDGALLIVDAAEGPMPQTRFVLSKALELGIKIIVVINKIDKPAGDPDGTLDKVFDLFTELTDREDLIDFPYIYASSLNGFAIKHLDDERKDMVPLLDCILENIQPPTGDAEKPFQFRATTLDYNEYVGRIVIGRVANGRVHSQDQVAWVKADGSVERGKITKLFGFKDLGRVEINESEAGDIVGIAGFSDIHIGETLCDPNNINPLPLIHVDEPTLQMNFSVNDSPFAGQEGKFVTSRQLRKRLYDELEKNVSLRVEDTDSTDCFKVSGRGELHLGILIETMRREGYEFQVSKPEVIYKGEGENLQEPFENLLVDVPEEYAGACIDRLSGRKATIPVSKSQVFSTAENNQTAVDINVLQGERPMASDNKSLGMFRLEGIAPAMRGVPQIEVTFDIDANGIVNVSAKDKATNKEQKITITNSSNLSEQDIDKMVKEAEANASEDKKKKEEAEIKNNANSLITSSERIVKDFEGKISDEDVKKLTEHREALQKALDENKPSEELKKLSEELQQTMFAISQKAYEAVQKEGGAANSEANSAGSENASSDKKDDDVIDAEFTKE